jgi:hypothetical protein
MATTKTSWESAQVQTGIYGLWHGRIIRLFLIQKIFSILAQTSLTEILFLQ